MGFDALRKVETKSAVATSISVAPPQAATKNRIAAGAGDRFEKAPARPEVVTLGEPTPAAAQPAAGQAAWIAASRFSPATQPEALAKVLRSVEEAKAAGLAPVVVFDIDNTLFPAEGRLLHVLQLWLEGPEGKAVAPEVRSAIAELGVQDLFYGPALSLKRAGINIDDESGKALLAGVLAVFNREFYRGEHLADDEAYPGASAFARKLHDAGAELVYLTGRPQPTLKDGTVAALRRNKFPLGKGAKLLMKPSLTLDDLTFKTEAFDKIDRLGKVVATFENEPTNAVAFSVRYPTASNVYIETASSERAAMPGDGLFHIKDFVGLPHA